MNRERLKRYAEFLAAAVVAVLAARYGIPYPNPHPAPPSIPAVPPSHPELDPPVPPTPPKPRTPIPDAPRAIVRIQFGNAGCSATILGPRRDDGRWWVLTAGHCVQRVGQHGTMRLLDGRTSGIVVAAINKVSDCAWCVTETNSEEFPFAFLAERSPAAGTKIWHAGYGFDRPGNREEGEVTATAGPNGQIRMLLSVSNGDSGGGICVNENNEVISCVCCTAGVARKSSVWGASPESIHASKPTVMALDDWTPLPVPIRDP